MEFGSLFTNGLVTALITFAVLFGALLAITGGLSLGSTM